MITRMVANVWVVRNEGNSSTPFLPLSHRERDSFRDFLGKTTYIATHRDRHAYMYGQRIYYTIGPWISLLAIGKTEKKKK